MFNRFSKLQALREANIVLLDRIKNLEAQNENLLNRLMSRDYSEYSASQVKQEDDQIKIEQDDRYLELDEVDPTELHGQNSESHQ